jgi:hypothetical protein
MPPFCPIHDFRTRFISQHFHRSISWSLANWLVKLGKLRRLPEDIVHRSPLDHVSQSKKWSTYFQMNSLAARDLPWDDARVLTPEERAIITSSIQQFQLGEGSNGRRLLRCGQEYAQAVDDPLFAGALAHFVEEEERHSWHLARFMEVQDIPVLRKHWVDTVFRGLRGLAGSLEVSLTVLVTAELVAVPYYRALRDATNSVILRAISAKILEDEAAHLKFQASMLARLASKRSLACQRLLSLLHLNNALLEASVSR